MGLFDLFKEQPHSLVSSTVFDRFPTEININIIECLLAQQPFDIQALQSLLLAIPPLSSLFLLITDHPENPCLLLQAPHVAHVSIHDYAQLLWEQPRQPPIKIFSLAHTDSATTNGDLSHFSSCLYGRHLSAKIPVVCGVYHTQSIGYELIQRLCKRAGVSRFQSLMLKGQGRTRRAMQLPTDVKGNKRDCPMFLSMIGPEKTIAQRIVSLLASDWPFEVEFAQLLDIQTGDDPKLDDWVYTDTEHTLKTLQVRFTKKLTLQEEGDQLPVKTTLRHSNLGPLEHLHIEFDTHVVPNFQIRPNYRLWMKPYQNCDFSLVNVNWTPSEPSGPDVENELTFIPQDQISPNFLEFVKVFHTVKYVGVPDEVVERTDKWNMVKQFCWWRMSPKDGVERSEHRTTHSHICPKMETFKIVSTTRQHPVTLGFTLPSLQHLTLVSLDNGVWNLGRLLNNNQDMTLLKTVVLVLLGDYQTPSSLQWKDVAAISTTVEELTVIGYHPNFLSSPECLFPNLQTLTMDIYPIIKCDSKNPQDSEVVKVDLSGKAFPLLSTMRLIVLEKDRTISLHDSSTLPGLTLTIPSSCTNIEVSCNVFVPALVVNGSPIDNNISVLSPGGFSRWTQSTGSWSFVGDFRETLAFDEF